MIVRILMLFVLWAGPLAAAWGQENQCGENAALDGVGYVISPSGGDDTETTSAPWILQCPKACPP